MDWLNDHAWAAWLGLAAAFGVAEMFSLDLIFMMLAVGAMGGMVAGAFDAHVAVQVLVAMGMSLATLTLLRPRLVARLHGGPELRLGTGKLIGTQGVVTAQITATQSGRVRLS
ncbi:MAG: NfeD family protein, partial [Actinobacteria bacterium]|nr:NfeD family protein [Actinomycetota bacterium]